MAQVFSKKTHLRIVLFSYRCVQLFSTGLFHGAALYLKPGGLFFMYGPFKINGEIFGQKNKELDAKLRKTNYLWGLREVFDELTGEAYKFGIYLLELHELPDDNQVLVWKKEELIDENPPTTSSTVSTTCTTFSQIGIDITAVGIFNFWRLVLEN